MLGLLGEAATRMIDHAIVGILYQSEVNCIAFGSSRLMRTCRVTSAGSLGCTSNVVVGPRLKCLQMAVSKRSRLYVALAIFPD